MDTSKWAATQSPMVRIPAAASGLMGVEAAEHRDLPGPEPGDLRFEGDQLGLPGFDPGAIDVV